MWVLKKNLKSPAVPLGQFCREAPAVSRKRMHIAWPHQNAFYEADIKYNKEGKPIIANKKKILDITKLPFDPPQKTQNFRPPDEIELTFAAYKLNKGEVMALNLKTKKIKNYSNAPSWYSEPEGIFPDGKHTLIECNKHDPRSIFNLDIYKLLLDGSGQSERLTHFCEFKGYKATNPAVSDDGKFFAFQYAKVGDAGGVGRGILLFDIEEYEKNKK
jgi:Tol biopolymer transport system component